MPGRGRHRPQNIAEILEYEAELVTGRFVSTRLTKVTEDMSELANGNREFYLEPSQDRHEIGRMTNAMAVFLDNARKTRDLDAEMKEKEQRERQREEKLQDERRAIEEREAARRRLATMERFQQQMDRVLGDSIRQKTEGH